MTGIAKASHSIYVNDHEATYYLSKEYLREIWKAGYSPGVEVPIFSWQYTGKAKRDIEGFLKKLAVKPEFIRNVTVYPVFDIPTFIYIIPGS